MNFTVPYRNITESPHYRAKGRPEVSSKAEKRYEILQKFWLLKKKKVDVQSACRILGMKKATLYRWNKKFKNNLRNLEPISRRPKKLRMPEWSLALESKVCELRHRHRFWGAPKILRLLEREGISTSRSTVDRILQKLMALNRVKPVRVLRVGKRPGKRHPRPHAKRLRRKPLTKDPGDIIQIDHMSVNHERGSIKHFAARDVVSKWEVTEGFDRATARNAKEFLEVVIREMPFPIKAIQVDGGSEFMKDFEKACQEKNIPLLVLPPNSPKLNGNVEHSNGFWRYEFYYQFDYWPDTIAQMRPFRKAFQKEYHSVRPHQNLGGLTPLEFLQKNYPQWTLKSQMY